MENEPPLPARTEKIVVSEPSHEAVVRKKEKRETNYLTFSLHMFLKLPPQLQAQ